MTDGPIKDLAPHHRKMAAEARAKAEAMFDYDARVMLMKVAAMWDLMAEAAAIKPSSSN
jgi:hypothetical protein